jgi:hypothetical protein
MNLLMNKIASWGRTIFAKTAPLYQELDDMHDPIGIMQLSHAK